MFKQYIMTYIKNETVWKILDEVSVLALCLCLSYATYTFHIVSRSGFRVLPHLYWWTTAFQLFFFAALPKFCLSCFKKQNTQWSGIKNVIKMYYLSLQNIFQSIAANLIQGKLFSHFSRIFFLLQMCYHTLPTESFLTNFRRRQTHDKHKNNIGWLLFLGNLLPRFLSYSASRGWVG